MLGGSWSKADSQKNLKNKAKKGWGGLAQVVECLPSKHEAEFKPKKKSMPILVTGEVAQWDSPCHKCLRPWVWSPALTKKKRKRKKRYIIIYTIFLPESLVEQDITREVQKKCSPRMLPEVCCKLVRAFWRAVCQYLPKPLIIYHKVIYQVLLIIALNWEEPKCPTRDWKGW
jgi:hypothetical protein